MQRPDVSAVCLCLAIIVFFTPVTAAAFHGGGEGYCEGCHVLHGSGTDRNEFTVTLRSSDPSSTCLRCHAGPGSSYLVYSIDGSAYTPGGDFYWLKKSFFWNSPGKISRSNGEEHGHNIIASDYGFFSDSRLISAPGGTYPSASLGCTSCHDPHARSAISRRNIKEKQRYDRQDGTQFTEDDNGNFRLLGGTGYSGGRGSGNIFSYPAPVAVSAMSNLNETDSNHTAYGSGMSEWCANCHDGLLNSADKHPSGNNAKLPPAIISSYNSYISTGDITGAKADAYLALVPFESGDPDTSRLDPFGRSGPDAGGRANVMCLTCHRAHASAFQAMGRWDFGTTFIADSHPKQGDGGATGRDILHSYYGRNMAGSFGNYQRQFCNKCHQMD